VEVSFDGRQERRDHHKYLEDDMAGRGRTSFQKRQKEQARLEKRQEKEARKQQRQHLTLSELPIEPAEEVEDDSANLELYSERELLPHRR
jgi:hypothetical protein